MYWQIFEIKAYILKCTTQRSRENRFHFMGVFSQIIVYLVDTHFTLRKVNDIKYVCKWIFETFGVCAKEMDFNKLFANTNRSKDDMSLHIYTYVHIWYLCYRDSCFKIVGVEFKSLPIKWVL